MGLKQQSLSRFFLVVFSGKFIALLLTLITPMILVRIFTRDEYGLYYQLFTAAMMFELAFVTGLRPSIFFFSPKFKEKHFLFCVNAIMVNLLIALPLLFIVFLFRHEIAQLLDINHLVGYLPLMVLYSTFHLVSILLPAHFVVTENAKMAAISEIWFAFLRTFLLLSAAVFLGTPESLLQALLLWSFVKFCVTIYVLALKRYSQLLSSWKEYWRFLVLQLKYALPLGFGSIFQMIIVRADRAIVASWFGAAGVASYAIGFFRIPLIGMFFNSLSEVIIPRLAIAFANKNEVEAKRIWLQAIEKSVLILFPIGIFFFVFGEEFIVTLFTQKYSDAVPIFRFSSLLAITQAVSYGAVIRASGKTGFILYVNLISLATFFLMITLLQDFHGLAGVAAAVVASQFVRAISTVFFSLKVLGSSVLEFPWARIIGVLVTTFVITFLLKLLLLQVVPDALSLPGFHLLNQNFPTQIQIGQLLRLVVGTISIVVSFLVIVTTGLIKFQLSDLRAILRSNS